MQKTARILCLSAVALLVGCQSGGAEYAIAQRKVSVETNPTGARLYQIVPLSKHPRLLGTTPLYDQPVDVLVSTAKADSENPFIARQLEKVRIRIVKEGFREYESDLSTSENQTAKHTVKLEAAE